MGNNGIVTEKAHLNVDKEKFDSGYDRIFKAKCYYCEKIDSKSKMVLVNFGGPIDSFYHEKCSLEIKELPKERDSAK